MAKEDKPEAEVAEAAPPKKKSKKINARAQYSNYSTCTNAEEAIAYQYADRQRRHPATRKGQIKRKIILFNKNKTCSIIRIQTIIPQLVLCRMKSTQERHINCQPNIIKRCHQQ